jgi:hypothetical protein
MKKVSATKDNDIYKFTAVCSLLLPFYSRLLLLHPVTPIYYLSSILFPFIPIYFYYSHPIYSLYSNLLPSNPVYSCLLQFLPFTLLPHFFPANTRLLPLTPFTTIIFPFTVVFSHLLL